MVLSLYGKEDATPSIWVYLEHEGGVLERVSLELLGHGRTLADQMGWELAGLVLAQQGEDIANEAILYGADQVWLMEHPSLEFFTIEAFQAVRDRLTDSGRFVFALPSSAHYLAGESLLLLASVHRALQGTFDDTFLLAGESMVFVGGGPRPALEDLATRFAEHDTPMHLAGDRTVTEQAAKQVIFQKVRDAEREKVYDQFASRLGDLVTGVLRRFEANNNMILELDKTEVLFPLREMMPNEIFRRGDRVKAVIKHVYKEASGAQVIVSRTDNRFLAKLLELETPEIANGSIEIKDIVRQPGERAKVAVFTREKDIDPVGACIGIKGNRILAISQELQGEKIDIIEWSDNPLYYAKAALSPAKVERVFVRNKSEKMLQAVVAKDHLSLAIGKKGLNVRLASILVGYRIEINQI